MNAIEFINVSKAYKSHSVLENISFQIISGSFVVVSGESGAGKSTLLNLISAMEEPSSGQVLINGHDVWKMPSRERTNFYRREIGVIFQSSYLQPQLTLLENITLPGVFAGIDEQKRLERAKNLAEYLGISENLNSLPSEVSGGQAERACIARALLLSPKIILADEPTANLDAENAQKVLAILNQLRQEFGVTVLVATHDILPKKFATQLINIASGKLVTTNETARDI
ncbi:ABC transporter ATP-binding protein [Candidatus Saccharibacteria bacterium]|nr:ABC transporter ATP-binding protein [Candidatus Saccharibacteria bacterium]MBR1795861.1 ABC transporter ATP-binding protein [Candidatus Saccharibacteria bacterium]